MSRIEIEILLERYLKGETNALENERVEKWLADNDNENSEWQRLNKDGREQWLNNLFTDIKSSVNAGKVVDLHPKKIWWKSIAAVAAAAVIFLTLFFGWPAFHNVINPEKLMAMQVPANEKRELVLSDGSKIRINAGSEFQYPVTFNGNTREVYLTGEAYFDIVHDASKPFIVHTGNVITKVLGTAFNINADKKSNTVVVTVTRGKVSVADGTHLLGLITPNQQITYNTSNNEHIQNTVDANEVIAWQENDLHFEDITFEQAAKELQQRFKINIKFSNDKVKNCRFSGTALKGKNIDQVLKVLCSFNNATYQHNPDGSITIDGKGCN
jgi:transmembrane sensor